MTYNDRKELDDRYYQTLVQMMASQAYRELAAAQMFGYGLQFVPELKWLKFMTWHIREEMEHYEDVVKIKGRLMVTSSSDVPMKGLVPLLEAIAKLRTERDIDLIVIGQPQAKGRVASTIERLGLGDIVTTITGVSDETLARLYGEAEVAIVPSLYEGFSLPAIEAMSCAVPVVATTGGALPEVVGTSGETGLLVEPNNPGALVNAIRSLLDDAELRQRLGDNGRQRVIQRFTWQVTARGTAACYEAILGQRPLPEAMDFH